jgi:type II secretory ATPase GspE/PulE/Tfp pilus assembly ATPase PilB-like protein
VIDQWYFEIGDGTIYGPYSMEKLQKWAAAGNLMPTHRVRRADSAEWTIAAYVPGLEITLQSPEGDDDLAAPSKPRSLGDRMLGRGRKSPDSADDTPDAPRAKSPPKEPPNIVALCDEIMETAFERGASDIHIDPEENVVLVQLRVDGELEALRKLPRSLHGPVIGRLKVISKMDIAEKRLPQDGRFSVELGPDQQRIHIRAACLPTTHGERMTLRLLAVETANLTLNRLGMSKAAMLTFAEHAGQRQGMVMLSGPTGSGKSTTLYAALRHRLANHPGRIITVEDPVEFDIVGVAQSEVDAADKVNFRTVLRNILRSDPDVIMIGEIRDSDSADIAIKAALTGHLVFSSLHTNSAAGVVTRLIDMGIESYRVAATLRLSVAQRLLRKLCPHCRKPRELSEAEARIVERPEAAGAPIYEPGSCDKCKGRGYKGRIGIFELLPIDQELSRQIVAGCSEGDIVAYARSQKWPSLRQEAAEKLLTGFTSYGDLIEATTAQ